MEYLFSLKKKVSIKVGVPFKLKKNVPIKVRIPFKLNKKAIHKSCGTRLIKKKVSRKVGIPLLTKKKVFIKVRIPLKLNKEAIHKRIDTCTVILSNFRKTCTVRFPNLTVSNSNFFLKIHWEYSTYRTFVLLLKT
jgi:hypothetical protein